MSLSSQITTDAVRAQLKTVFDPETNLSIVDMGLIYDVTVTKVADKFKVNILYTLTTPGCPLAGVLQSMMASSLVPLQSVQFNPEQDVSFELTFDPPWTIDMLSPEARAEMGW